MGLQVHGVVRIQQLQSPCEEYVLGPYEDLSLNQVAFAAFQLPFHIASLVSAKNQQLECTQANHSTYRNQTQLIIHDSNKCR